MPNPQQRLKLGGILRELEEDPYIGHFQQPLPISIVTQYWLQKCLGNDKYVFIGYDVNKTLKYTLIFIKIIRFSELEIKNINN